MVVVVGLIRLGVGWRIMARLRRGVVVGDEGADGLLVEARAALGLRRPVVLARHPAVGSPIVLGGLRPVVLVPPDWDDWPRTDRRTCLLHELSHLARLDDWTKLAQEVVRVPFGWHPLVRWLLVRLDRERELLCDEAAVARGADPVTYARLLLTLASRSRRLHPVASPWSASPGRLAFLDRRTVQVRIDHLLEPDMPLTLASPSRGRALILGTLATMMTLLIGGLRVHAGSALALQAPAPVVLRSDYKVRGLVVDANDRPVSGATVVAGPDEPGKTGHDVLATDADGRFVWSPPLGTVSYGIVVARDGLAPSAIKGFVDGKIPVKDRNFRLGKPEPFAAVLVDGAGKPVVGATVRVAMFASGSVTSDTVSVGYTHIPQLVTEDNPVRPLFGTTTDAEGRFTFAAIPAESFIKVAITTADGRLVRARPEGRSAVGSTLADPAVQLTFTPRKGQTPRAQRLIVDKQTRLGQMMRDEGFLTIVPGKLVQYEVIPTARVVGQITSKQPGVDLAGLTVSYQASQPDRRSQVISGNFGGSVLVDADGRFVIDSLNAGTINIFAHAPGENRDWTYCAARDVQLDPGQTTRATIDLTRGVDVEGSVRVHETGQPVAGAQIGVYGPFRPRSGAMTIGATTDAQGRYHYRLPPGETDFYIMGGASNFLPPSRTVRSNQTVTIPNGVETFVVPPIEVREPGLTVHARLLGAAGQPVAGALVAPWPDGAVTRPQDGFGATTDARGEFFLRSEMSVGLSLGKSLRLLIHLPDGTEQTAAIVPATNGVISVQLAAPAL